MLSRSNGTRKLMNNSNSLSTISNASSVSMNAVSGMQDIDLASFIGKTLLPIEKMETYIIDETDMNSLRNGIVTDEMVNRIKLVPKTIYAGSLMNKLRKTNKYTLSKRPVYNVVLIKKNHYINSGSRSNAYALIGIIDRDSEMMNSLIPTEIEFVNMLYSMNVTVPLNQIGNSGSNSGSSMTGLIPAAGNVLSGLFAGGRVLFRKKQGKKTRKVMKKTKKAAKKASRRRRTARKH